MTGQRSARRRCFQCNPNRGGVWFQAARALALVVTEYFAIAPAFPGRDRRFTLKRRWPYALLCSKVILDVIKASLYNNLKRSLSRYLEKRRPEWLMHKNPTSGTAHIVVESVYDGESKRNGVFHDHPLCGARRYGASTCVPIFDFCHL